MYLTSQALETLKEELEHRKKEVRKEIAEKISAAKDLGDLSENFEYHEAKEQQMQNESRIIEIENSIKNVIILSPDSVKGNRCIVIGSAFTVKIDDKQMDFQIVGSTEANPLQGKISNESPLGKAFLGHSLGEEIEIDLPIGKKYYSILEIK
ncbi:transcription elongation factor GreA [Candidatus Uhrbacteria bacterium CG_4_9_14_3_um_filter_36_7]|uniref:Transcription elongation factor GreA n=1 Tax=Candidatus Uhrbacteria bacterium CG_4_9_14_3_um_filter_36_7 TaxID=1975033 RepID=A0A2M7XII1_9BACT|nr:MAG: transcription elongation factor GreA [Candidatus Uhrbacteria bacterium CG_4_9_14_3_um_filter_36_7]